MAAFHRFIMAASAVALCTGQAHADPIQKTTVSGHVLKIFFTAALNLDCTSAGVTVVRVTAGPDHGAVSTRMANDFAYFPAANERSRCNTRRVRGTQIEYRSKAGYLGPDAFTLNIIGPSGTDIFANYQINVK